MIISQTEPLVETFVRQLQNHWQYTLTEGLESTVYLVSIQASVSLADIYRKVEFAGE